VQKLAISIALALVASVELSPVLLVLVLLFLIPDLIRKVVHFAPDET
jgi:hypothetical protein